MRAKHQVMCIVSVASLLVVGLVLFLSLIYLFFQVWDREAIHDATRTGDVDRARRILDSKPSRLEQRNRLDLTPLLNAAMYGQVEVASFLISRGADVNAKWNLVASDDGDWNALHIAALRGSLPIIKLMVVSGTDINAVTKKGQTPLDIAVQNGNGDIVHALKLAGGVSSQPQRDQRKD